VNLLKNKVYFRERAVESVETFIRMYDDTQYSEKIRHCLFKFLDFVKKTEKTIVKIL